MIECILLKGKIPSPQNVRGNLAINNLKVIGNNNFVISFVFINPKITDFTANVTHVICKAKIDTSFICFQTG